MPRYFNSPPGYITIDQLRDRLGMKNIHSIHRAINAGQLQVCKFQGSGRRFFIKEEDAGKFCEDRSTPKPVLKKLDRY